MVRIHNTGCALTIYIKYHKVWLSWYLERSATFWVRSETPFKIMSDVGEEMTNKTFPSKNTIKE
jgi:hypothetical protein